MPILEESSFQNWIPPLFFTLYLMIIYSRDLPSGGKLGGSSSYEIKPVTFIELFHQKTSPELSNMRAYVRDLKLLIKCDENIKSAPICDADYLIYLMKMLTINESMKFRSKLRCPHCGEEIIVNYDSRDVKPTTIDEIVTEVELGGMMRKVHLPNIEEFLLFIDRLPPYSDDWGLDLIKLYSLFYDYVIQPPVGMVTQLVDNAVWTEITHLMAIESMMLESFDNIEKKCSKCQGGLSIGALASVENMFRLTLQSNPVNSDKIRTKQVRETGESRNV